MPDSSRPNATRSLILECYTDKVWPANGRTSSGLTASLVPPRSEVRVVDDDPPCGQLVQQLRYSGRCLTVSRDDYRPLQVLSKFSRNDLPSIEWCRGCRSDLNEGPVSNQRECDLLVRQWTAHDEMIVAMHQDAYHRIIPYRIEGYFESSLAFAVRIACTSLSASS